MKKITLTTPENIEIEYKLADLGSRTGAAIIDLIIQNIILILIAIPIFFINFLLPNLWEAYFGWIVGGSLFIIMLIYYGYYIIMELRMNGMTPGKKLLKIRTIRKNGQPLTLKHSAIRTLFRLFIDMIGLGVLYIFFTKEHRRIGDFAASTIVIVDEMKRRPLLLEVGQEKGEWIRNYLSNEEYRLISEYLKRRDSLEDSSMLRDEIRDYLKERYKDSESIDEIEKIIRSI